MQTDLFSEDHEAYRGVVREFIAREVSPHYESWEEEGLTGREVWLAAGKQGVIGLAVPPAFGGAGERDYRYRMIVAEEIAASSTVSWGLGLSAHDDVVVPYVLELGTPQQQQHWLPGLASGELIGAIAMTEPAAGSDLKGIRTTATRDGNDWIISGQKTFITNGILSDLVIVAARTDPPGGRRAISLFVVEAGTPGFSRGRKLDKIGLRAQDTAELFFDDVRVPAENLLGEEGQGFVHMMDRLPRERISIAASAIASAEAVYRQTRDYCFERTAFGKPIGDFQHTRFGLAEMATEIEVSRAYVDRAILALNDGRLTAVDAAKAKWWTSELQKRVVDRCLQLHGGYGYMREYPVARAFVDSRVQTIYGGTTEIMKEIIGREIARSR